jgi:hypothetical protein
MPILQTDTVVYTFADVIEHLCDLHKVDQDGLNVRNAKRAILNAYRDLANKHTWSYHVRQRLLQTVASYSTGTIDFDYTGGANERQLTLATGTWPSWAEYGRVIIDSVHYEVERRISTSILTLREDSNPGADVAAATTYEIYRNSYPLPANYRRLGHLWDVDQKRVVPFVDQQEHHDGLNCFFETPATPWTFTIRGSSDYYGASQLVLGPPPDAVRNYDLLYEAFPRPLSLDGYTTGTIAISGTTVTGTGTTFPTNCAGSILRVSSTDAVPTGLMGANPFTTQHVIKSRTSATVLVLEETASTVSGMGYTISDPIDVDPAAINAFLRMAEAEFCLADGRKDALTRKALAQEEFTLAVEGDQREPRTRGPRMYDPFSNIGVTTE